MRTPEFSLPFTDPVLVFALVMLIILLAPLAFARLRVPGIVGLIITGAVIGPSALGLLERNETMVLLGTVGLLYLMFMAGLALDLNQFNRHRHQSLTFGLFSFFIPQLMGILAGVTVLGLGWAPSLLLGSIIGSHTLLAYPIATRLGIAKNLSVTMTMGGTLVTDSVSLSVLAVVAAATTGSLGPIFWLQFLGLVALYVAAVAFGLPRLGQWFFRSVRNEPDTEFVFLVAALFLTAYLAGVAGLAPIIGAFMAGLSLNRLVPESSTLMSRIQFVGNALFVPFFLVSVGMLVDFRVLFQSLAVWGFALTLTALVVVGKTAAARVVQRIFGASSEEGWLMAGLSIPQAAATLAVTMVGFELGLFGETIVNAVVIMILITCLLGPWLVETYGRRVALQEERKPFEPSQAPQRILVPLANPETASNLVDMALMIRDPDSQQPLFPLTIAQDGPDVQAHVAAGEKLLGHAVVHAAAAHVPVIPVIRVDYNAVHGIIRAVKERMISTIIIGWHAELSARQFIFGSVLDQLLIDSREMVLVSKIEHPLNTVQRIVLAAPPFADRARGFPEALRTAKILANQMGADLLLLAPEAHLPAFLDALNRTKPQVPTKPLPLSTWSRLLPTLDTHLKTDDLLLVLSARKDTAAWRPALDRLPRIVARRFPATSLVVLYPPEQAPTAAPKRPAPDQEALAALLQLDHITLALHGDAPAKMLGQMLEPAFSEDAAVFSSAIRMLTESNPERVPELMPGVVFYHTHLEQIPRPMLFVGVSKAGVRFPDADSPVYVVLILLSPAQASPEDHLRRLAEMAHVLRTPEIVDRLRQAQTKNDVRALLTSRLEIFTPS